MSWSYGNLEDATLRLANQEKSLHSDSHWHYLKKYFSLSQQEKKIQSCCAYQFKEFHIEAKVTIS